MKDFAEKLINDIQNSILKDVQKITFLKVDFNSKKTIPTEFIESAWRKVDWDSVLMRVTENLETRIERNFGMMRPEGYRKTIRLMNLANKFNIPIISFIDLKPNLDNISFIVFIKSV